jgi:phenylalanyl-tRNA synthetase alpha subunit
VSRSVEKSLIAKSEHFMKLKILDHSWENGNYWLKAEVRVSKEKIDDILKKESSSKKENELLQNIDEQNKKITKLMKKLEDKLDEKPKKEVIVKTIVDNSELEKVKKELAEMKKSLEKVKEDYRVKPDNDNSKKPPLLSFPYLTRESCLTR